MIIIICSNILGSFEFICESNFVLGSDGKSCQGEVFDR